MINSSLIEQFANKDSISTYKPTAEIKTFTFTEAGLHNFVRNILASSRCITEDHYNQLAKEAFSKEEKSVQSIDIDDIIHIVE
jgi:hypothetical protein